MGSEHESDPLIAPRGDEPAGSDAEPAVGEPLEGSSVGEPERDSNLSSSPSSSEVGSERDFSTRVGAPLAEPRTGAGAQSPNMLPSRKGRGHVERTFVRVIATGGIVGICVAIAAIMASSNSQGWVIGLVVSLVSVVLAALLWSSRIL